MLKIHRGKELCVINRFPILMYILCIFVSKSKKSSHVVEIISIIFVYRFITLESQNVECAWVPQTANQREEGGQLEISSNGA